MLRKIIFSLICVSLVSSFAAGHILYTEKQRKELTVAFLDIGQGDAIFIEAPNGNQILVDGGPSAKVLHEIGKIMPWYDKTIDMIVITNPDKDHIAGFVDVLKRYVVMYALEPGTQNKTPTHEAVQELIKEKGVQKLTARRGMNIDLGDGVVLSVLFPDKDVSDLKTNDGSIVMRLTYDETEGMLTGDATSAVERHILSYDENIQSDIIKVGHHGSKTSTDGNCVKALRPQYAVISCGQGNRYGHPNEETLVTLGKFPLKVLRTDQEGTIIMKSDGKQFRQQ